MIGTKKLGLGLLLALGMGSYGLGGCSAGSGGGSDTGGAGETGGATNTGGSHASGGSSATGGASSGGSTGGSSATGGAVSTGGSSTGGASTTGGSSATGGASSGGGGAAGGSTNTGGKASTGGGGGAKPPATGGAGGSTTPGTCTKGQTKGSDVVIMGESFYAIDPQYIQNRIQDDARKAGSLGASDKYKNVAVSGQNMNYIATTEWTNATQGGKAPKYVIMDGGGIDCLSSNGSPCTTCPGTFKTLLGKMGTAGVQEVIYTRYPEPGNPPGSNASLKACLDATMPNMQTACEGSTSPKCHWVDLRPVWVNGDTTDGLHPTQSGGEHVGDKIWSEMMNLCFAQ